MKHFEDEMANPDKWWNKLRHITEEELDVLPDSYINKFGVYLDKTREMQKISAWERNIGKRDQERKSAEREKDIKEREEENE